MPPPPPDLSSATLQSRFGERYRCWVLLTVMIGNMGATLFGRTCLLPLAMMQALSRGAMRTLPAPLISAGAGTMNFMRQTGGALGFNLVGIVLAWRLQACAAQAAGGTLRAFHEVFEVMAVRTTAAAATAWRMRRPAPAASPG